ncbi:tubulin polyglutamylase TTLL5-like [Saccoglossus kowalevskii]
MASTGTVTSTDPSASDSDAATSGSDVSDSNANKSGQSDDDSVDSVTDEEEEEDEEEDVDNDSHLIWSGPGRKLPIVSFKAEALFTKVKGLYHMGEKHHLAYKMVKTECRLIRQILAKHGFHEAHPNSSDFNLMWTGSHVKPFTLRSLTEFQKVNHFPRSYELTRKDRLYKNIQRMQHSKGVKQFDFIPQSFISPSEFDDFNGAHLKEKGTWIVKPIASSRGRGIFLINHPQQLPLDETLLVARYIASPLTIDGFKFDLRIYVAVTSYDPVRIYIYEEGLTRFATVQYDKSAKSIRNTCMHLTNYSINKKSNDFVRCDDPSIEDYGNKWSLGAVIRYLKKQGRDVTNLVSKMEDLVIKTILAGELPIATACKMFMPNRGNCFELYGFDILVDDNLKPWLLEVNLSPSLACDAPLDMKIKANMIADLFTLTGFIAHDPMVRKTQQSKRNQELAASSALRQQKERVGSELVKQRPQSAGTVNPKNFTAVGARPNSSSGRPGNDNRLNAEELRIIRETKEENQRRGGWIRIFPSPESWEKYGNFLESRTTHNEMLHRKLYPDRRLAFIQDQMTMVKKEHMVQFQRKLSTIDNRADRKKLRNSVSKPPRPASSNKPVTTTVKDKPQEKKESTTRNKRETLAQGELKVEEKTKKTSTSSMQQAETKPKTTSTGTTKAEKENVTEVNGKAATDTDNADKPASESNNNREVLKEKPPVPPKPRINVKEIIDNGGELSKLQARHAFATYLLRVQLRLMEETNRPEERTDPNARNDEQMDLVLRFLKRAAGNLQQPFKVIVPSRKLPINDRRRILAKQLGDFVHIYGKETEQLQQRKRIDRKYVSKDADHLDSFDEDKFKSFINVASESELEEVLTVYTKMNKSASIFLGTNSKSTSDLKGHSSSIAQGPSQSLLQRRSSTSELHKVGIAEKEKAEAVSGDMTRYKAPQMRPKSAIITRERFVDSTTGENSTQAGKAKIIAPPPGDNNYLPASSAAYASVASIYSAKLATVSRSRPSSAKSTQSNSGISLKSFSRPSSAITVYRDNTGGEIATRHFSEDSEQAIQDALQRLARRQAARQYSSSSMQNQNLLTHVYLGQYSGSTGSLDNPTCPGSLSASRGSANAGQRSRMHSWEGMKSHSTTSVTGTYPTTAQNYVNRQVMSQEQISQTQSQLHDLAKMSQERMKQQQSQPHSEVRRSSVSESTRSNPTSAGTATSSTPLDGAPESNSYASEGNSLAPSELANAYNTVIGVAPQNNYQPSPGSYQLQYALQQQLQQQQTHQHQQHHQSRPSTSQSASRSVTAALQNRPATAGKSQEAHYDHTRSRHQAKIAQAHNNMSQQLSPQQLLTPKPPIQMSSGSRKPVSIQRLARTTQFDNGYPNDRDLYTSLRYNTSLGLSSKTVHNSGYSSTGQYLTRLASQWKGGSQQGTITKH